MRDALSSDLKARISSARTCLRKRVTLESSILIGFVKTNESNQK